MDIKEKLKRDFLWRHREYADCLGMRSTNRIDQEKIDENTKLAKTHFLLAAQLYAEILSREEK